MSILILSLWLHLWTVHAWEVFNWWTAAPVDQLVDVDVDVDVFAPNTTAFAQNLYVMPKIPQNLPKRSKIYQPFTKYFIMVWNGPKGSKMVHNGLKCFKLCKIVTNWSKIVKKKKFKWSKMILKIEMVQNDPKWYDMVQYSPNWS